MKNTIVLFLLTMCSFLMSCIKPIPCPELEYHLHNISGLSVEVTFYKRGQNYIKLDLLHNEKKKMDTFLDKCDPCYGSVTLCSDSVKVTFADGKSKTDVSCLIYGDDSDPRAIDCRRDSINMIGAYSLDSKTFVFYVNEDDYREAR